MAIESLFDENLKWHSGLTEAQILDAKSKGIYEPIGPEYEQYLASVGIDINNLGDVGIVTEDKVFIENEDPLYNMAWHPDLTQEQILYALEKDIYEPVGQEYEQFLHELGLEPVEKTSGPIPPPPPPPHIPDPPPFRPIGGGFGGSVPRRRTPIGGVGGIIDDWDEDLIIEDPEYDEQIIEEPEYEEPTRRVPPVGEEPKPDKEEPNKEKEDPEKKMPPSGGKKTGDDDEKKGQPEGGKKRVEPDPNIVPPVGGEDPVVEVDPETEIEKEEEKEETLHVARVERRDKCHIPALLVAAAVAVTLASGFSIDDPIVTPTIITEHHSVINYQVDEQVREMVYQDKMIEEIVYSFLAEKDIDIGDKMNVGTGNLAYYYGNLTGKSVPISGEQTITGFCLYSPNDENVKYEYSFYEDRNLDGKAERLSPESIEQKLNVSLDEFLAELDTANYNLDDIRFSLHFGNRGWIDASDLIKVNGEVTQTTIKELVEVVKQGATYTGTVKDDVDFINVAQEGEEPVWVCITDDETDELLPAGTVVKGSDGKEYVISSLERETITTEHVVEGEEVEGKLKYSIMDCNLALGLAPLVAAAAIAIANKMKNKRNKENPDFFEFENDEEYLQFKRDFEQAREEYRSVSKFGNTLKRIFIGETYHISTELSEEQVEEMYTTIRNSNSEDYTYNPSDQIRIMEGQVFAIHEDGSKTNITKTVSHIGKDNPEEVTGLLTDEIKEEYGGGKKV